MPRKKKHPKAINRFIYGYARKSTDSEDKQVHSLDDQESMINKHYSSLPEDERKKYPLKILRESKSAFHPGREQFNKVMSLADIGNVHGVIVVHPNRISRNHQDSGAFVQRLVDGRISFLDSTHG
ncbi:MAG: recombinase family protein [Patescibacteria group bacterium]